MCEIDEGRGMQSLVRSAPPPHRGAECADTSEHPEMASLNDILIPYPNGLHLINKRTASEVWCQKNFSERRLFPKVITYLKLVYFCDVELFETFFYFHPIL